MTMEIIQLIHNFSASAGSSIVCANQLSDCSTNLPTVSASHATLTNLLQILFGALAILSVLMIAIGGGLRFILNAGNPQEMAKARNAIIYSAVGLVVALSGEAIVSFVIGKI